MSMIELQNTNKAIIKNANEKRLVRLSIILTTIFLFCSFLFCTLSITKHLPIPSSICGLLVKTLNFGSKWAAVIGIAFAMAWYVVTKLIKKAKSKNEPPKKIIITFAKIARRFHVPIAILALGFALVHGYVAILNGVKLNIGYITGLVALGIFVIVSFSGIRRYIPKHRLHLLSSVLLLAVLIVHIIYF
ncbi:hypothetical protein [Clostridium psychrophilum]|uniref:hypothetical protein n=1 Tax=Clostridium psychrophilum TaxID=132926 RepID=UPI001C0ABB82|nr:hypothetical protein [Clostridium psychrophilum]MBU3183090.1 hypothetical protein [Clostridium psychrophilum]